MLSNIININQYTLPDISLFTFTERDKANMSLWIPDSTMVIMGRGSDTDAELRLDNIISDDVPVIRRQSGGCAVVISKDMLVCSMALYHRKLTNPMKCYKLFNGIITDGLRQGGGLHVEQKGISDLSFDNKKLAGSSIYRNENIIFYHCIINLEGDVSLIERYLRHPPKEPAYRNGRRHRDFVRAVNDFGVGITKELLIRNISIAWRNTIKKL